MSQLRRRSSLDSTLNITNTIKSNRKDSHVEASSDRKVTDKLTVSAKSSKSTSATRQTSIKEQLKPKIATTRNNKRSREELKQQIFAGIKLMLDPIKEDIEQIKIDQRGLETETQKITGQKLKQQIVKNEEKQKKLEHRISVLEDQLLEKNIIFKGLTEDEFDDIGDTKAKIILVLATVNEGATAEDRKEVAKKIPIDSIERMGKFNAHRPRPVKVKFVNKSDVSNLFRNRKKLPDGIFIDREYSKVTEKERRLLRPIVKAARKIEEYKGNCRLEGPYLKLNGK